MTFEDEVLALVFDSHWVRVNRRGYINAYHGAEGIFGYETDPVEADIEGPLDFVAYQKSLGICIRTAKQKIGRWRKQPPDPRVQDLLDERLRREEYIARVLENHRNTLLSQVCPSAPDRDSVPALPPPVPLPAKRRFRGVLDRRALLNKAQHRCQICGFSRHLVVHHIVPIAQGGSDNPDNLQVLCPNCHAEAHAKLRSRVA